MPNTSKRVEIDPFKEKLIELLYTLNLPSECDDQYEWMADRLIANGATILTEPECKKINIKLPKEIVVHPYEPKWIPVSERLPKPYVDVITLRQDLISQNYHACGLEYITLCGEADIPAWSKDHLTWKNKVTHWFPLPEPPKGE